MQSNTKEDPIFWYYKIRLLEVVFCLKHDIQVIVAIWKYHYSNRNTEVELHDYYLSNMSKRYRLYEKS